MKRIGNVVLADSSRAEFNGSVTAEELRELAAYPSLNVLQCSKPVGETVWPLLDECFFSARPDVELRVYGHYSAECDLACARVMTNVRRFAADCLMRAKNIEAIADIPHLESLSLGIFELEDFNVLKLIPTTLTSLILGATRSRKPSLSPLSRLRSLRVLYLEGQNKDIEVLGQLEHLEDVTLRSITTHDLRYLSCLLNLRSLNSTLGGIHTFDGIEGKRSIKSLELWQIRGVQNVDVVGSLPGLQNLFLQSLPHITSLPPLKTSRVLRRITLQNLKGLHDFTALETAPALEEFALLGGNKQMPEELLPILRNQTVRRVIAYFGSNRKNEHFARLQKEHGKAQWDTSEPFEYR